MKISSWEKTGKSQIFFFFEDFLGHIFIAETLALPLRLEKVAIFRDYIITFVTSLLAERCVNAPLLVVSILIA